MQPNIFTLNHNTRPDIKKYLSLQEAAEKKNNLEDNHDKIIQDPPDYHPQDATEDLCHLNLQAKQHLTNTEADDLHQEHDVGQYPHLQNQETRYTKTDITTLNTTNIPRYPTGQFLKRSSP